MVKLPESLIVAFSVLDGFSLHLLPMEYDLRPTSLDHVSRGYIAQGNVVAAEVVVAYEVGEGHLQFAGELIGSLTYLLFKRLMVAFHLPVGLGMEVTCPPKTVPNQMLVLWDDKIIEEGESSHEKVPVHGGAGRLRP